MRRRIPAAPAALALACLAGTAAAQTTRHVAPCGDDSWTGLSPLCSAPDGPKRTIQAAISASVSGDTVLVADGTYTGPGNRDLTFGGRNIVLRSLGGAAACTIDCENAARALRLNGFETRAAVVEGFTIRNGRTANVPAEPRGAGIACLAPQFGQAAPSPTIRGCVFIDCNSGIFNGGALFLGAQSTALVEGCRFVSNESGGGGAVQCENSNPDFHSCAFDANTAGVGGAVLLTASNPSFVNCLFTANAGSNPGGGAIFCNSASRPRIINCTFSGNAGTGGAVYSNRSSEPAIIGSVLWGNTPDQVFVAPGSTAVVNYSDVQGGWPGTGNASADPMFADPGSGDYSLLPGSPCIDAADNTALPPGVTLDLAGADRFFNDPLTPDSGVPGGAGGNDIADMGAFEFQGGGCYPDCDTSTGPGVLDIFDFLCFQNRYDAGSPYACDCDTSTGPGVCDIFDFLCFQNAFDAGCP